MLALASGQIARLGRFGFYATFAVAVTASVQLVCVYLVFAGLIIRALGTRARAGRRRLAVAYGLGATGFADGLALSALFDLPSGAVVIWALAGSRLIRRNRWCLWSWTAPKARRRLALARGSALGCGVPLTNHPTQADMPWTVNAIPLAQWPAGATPSCGNFYSSPR